MGKARSSRIGETLSGKYRLDELLGAGGMGEVYRAENVGIGREVAIKLLRDEYTEIPEVVGRFLREARAANIVRHPNVVDVLDIGQGEDGTPFIVQELLDGQDLAGYVRDQGGKLGVRDALTIMIPAIDAVAFAHARGVIHRDLKPENIFLARDPTGNVVPKLLDFGISRIVTGEEKRMTATGMSIGTPAYMSPEQIRADTIIDTRTDVWSIGVILHELVAGTLPFESASHTALFVKIVTELPTPLADALPGAPPALAAIVAKCLSARPVDRYAGAVELARDLRHFVAGGAGTGTEMIRTASSARRYAAAPVARAAHASQEFAAPARAPAVVPNLELHAPKASPVPQRPASSAGRAATEADFSDEPAPVRLDLAADPGVRPVPLNAQGQSLRVARATHGMRTDVEQGPRVSGGGIVGMGIMWALVLALSGALTTVLPDGWPVLSWATALDGAPAWLGFGVPILAFALGVGVFLLGVRAEPISWGLLVAAPGLVLDAILLAGFVVHGLPNLTGEGGLDGLARMFFPWPTILVLVGFCIVALRHGWAAWTSQHSSRVSGTALGVVLAAIALFAAVEIFRGAEGGPPTSSIAS